MELDEYIEPAKSGAISLVIAVAVTYAVSMIYPTSDLPWTLTAVGFGSFFSGFFSTLQTE